MEELKLYLGKSLKTSMRVRENKLSHLVHVYLTRHPSHQNPQLLQCKWTKTGLHLQPSRRTGTHYIWSNLRTTDGTLMVS